MKKNVMIRIDEDIAEKAKDLGLNISKVCENALIKTIKAMEGVFDTPIENNTISYLKRNDGGPSRDRTCDPRHVKAMSYH